MSAAGPTSIQEGLVRRGKALYETNRLKAALESFKEACLRCSCNKALVTSSKELGLSAKQIPIPICHCKDFTSLSTESDDGDKLAMYRLATKPCTCGSGVMPCQSSIHIVALDGMAAVCEAIKDYAKALQHASLLLIVAPHAPEGYLRMAKALRLKAQSNKSDAKSRCLWIYSQASMSVRTFGDKQHEKLKALQLLIRKDIVLHLPTELQQMVLGYLPYADLCRAMRVSKAWNFACRNNGLWAHLEFVKHWPSLRERPFRRGVLNDIISKRSQNLAKSLTITSLTDFGIDAAKLRAILKALPQLESLSLSVCSKESAANKGSSSSLSPDNVLTAISEGAPSTLKILHIRNLYKPDNLSFLDSPIARLAGSLEELSLEELDNWPWLMYILGSKVWPKLERLTIKGSDKSGLSCVPINILSAAPSTPALKDLTLYKVEDIGPLPDDFAAWGGLERLSIDRLCRRHHEGSLFGQTPALRSADFRNISKVDPRSFFGSEEGGLQSVDLFENLEHLCFHLDPDWMDHIGIKDCFEFQRIQPSCTNGTLRSLDIIFDSKITNRLDKVLNKQAIHTLSCHGIDAPGSYDDLNLTGNSDVFLQWVDTFPNLHTVGVYPEKTVKAWIVVAKLLRRRLDIKTIYTNVLTGVYRDELLARAARNGVKILHADRVPEPVLERARPLPGPTSQSKAVV